MSALLLLAAALAADPPADEWAGRRAMIVSSDPVTLTRPGPDGTPVPVVEVKNQMWVRIIASRGDEVLIRHKGQEGWLAKNRVLLPPEAVLYYTRRLLANPRDAAALNRRAAAYLEEGQIPFALRDAEACIRLAPRSATAFNTAGLARERLGHLDAAIAAYSKAITLGPNYLLPFENRGRCRYLTGDYAGAAEDLTAALDLDPDNPGALSRRGWARFQLGKLGPAIADFDQAIGLDPNLTKAYEGRGRARNALKVRVLAKVLADFDRVIELAPKSPDGYLCKAWVLATAPDEKVRDGKKAVELATRAVELSGGKLWSALAALAAAFAEVGDFSQAVKHQKRALELLGESHEETEAAKKQLAIYEQGKPYREE